MSDADVVELHDDIRDCKGVALVPEDAIRRRSARVVVGPS